MADSFDALEQNYQSTASAPSASVAPSTNPIDAMEQNYQAQSTQQGPQGNAFQNWSSQALGSIENLGGLAQKAVDYLTPEGIANRLANQASGIPEVSAKDELKSVFNVLAHDTSFLPGTALNPTVAAEDIGKGTFAGKVGEYTPLVLNPESLIEGVIPAVGTVANTIGTAGAGYLGNKVLGPAGEVLGVGAYGAAPAVASRAVSGIRSLFTEAPTESEALLQAFKVPNAQANDMKSALQAWQNAGVITNEGATPFNSSLENAIGNEAKATTGQAGALRQGMSEIIDQARPLTTKEILPSFQDALANAPEEAANEAVPIRGALGQKALSRAIADESVAARNIALSKNFPSVSPEEAGALYEQADPAAKKYYDTLVNNTQWSAQDVWKLRQQWDQVPSWSPIAEESAKGKAYQAMREALNNKLIAATGDRAPQLQSLFDQYSSLMDIVPTLKKMAGAETKGLTRAAPIGQRALSVFTDPLKTITGIGKPLNESPAQLLNRSAGDLPILESALAATRNPNAALPLAAGLGALEDTQPKSVLAAPGVSINIHPQAPVVTPTPIPLHAALPGVAPKLQPILQAMRIVESGGNDNAVGSLTPHGQAKGPFQFLDSTAQAYGITNPFDIKQAAPAAQKLLADNALILAKAGYTDPRLAIAAHNRGAGNILADLKASGARTWDQLLPYESKVAPETAGYIRKIEDAMRIHASA